MKQSFLRTVCIFEFVFRMNVQLRLGFTVIQTNLLVPSLLSASLNHALPSTHMTKQ